MNPTADPCYASKSPLSQKNRQPLVERLSGISATNILGLRGKPHYNMNRMFCHAISN